MSDWDPRKHPRHPKGSPQGGQFAPGDTVSVNGQRAKVIKHFQDGTTQVAFVTSSIHEERGIVKTSELRKAAEGFAFGSTLRGKLAKLPEPSAKTKQLVNSMIRSGTLPGRRSSRFCR